MSPNRNFNFCRVQRLPAQRVIRSLEQIIEWRGKPQAIRSDNGSEYVSAEFQCWAERQGIQLLFIQPGKPTQNAYIERFNRTVRHEWLDEHIFESLVHANRQQLNGYGDTILNGHIWP